MRLNLTRFKMLVWCCNEERTKKLGLMNVEKVGQVHVSISSNQGFEMYVYWKQSSCSLMDVANMQRLGAEDETTTCYNVVKHCSVNSNKSFYTLEMHTAHPPKLFYDATVPETSYNMLFTYLVVKCPWLWDSEIDLLSELRLLRLLQ